MAWSDLPRPVRDVINRYAEAKVAVSWKGSRDPEMWPEIDGELKAARIALVAVLETHAADMIPFVGDEDE